MIRWLGQLGQVEQLDLGQVRDPESSPGIGGIAARPPEIEVDLARAQRPIRRRWTRCARPVADRRAGSRCRRSDRAPRRRPASRPGLPQPVDDGAHPADRAAEVDRSRRRRATPYSADRRAWWATDRTGAQGLGRLAAVVEAGAADPVHLDQRGPLALAGRAAATPGPAWPAPMTIASYSTHVPLPGMTIFDHLAGSDVAALTGLSIDRSAPVEHMGVVLLRLAESLDNAMIRISGSGGLARTPASGHGRHDRRSVARVAVPASRRRCDRCGGDRLAQQHR